MHRHGEERRTARRQAGFTLVEILTAAVVVGVALAAVSWSMAAAVQARSALAEEPMAWMLAREVRELAETLPREPSGAGPATDPSGVLALDSLDGAVFSPPVRADGTADVTLSGWQQRTRLGVSTLAQPAVATLEDPRAGVDPSAERLYQLTVTIYHAGELVDTVEWWLTP